MLQPIAGVRTYSRYTTRAVKRIYKASFVRLTTYKHLQEFQDLTYKNIGVRFPLEFLRNSRTMALLNRHGKICGGFVLAEYQYSRVVNSLPDDALDRLKEKYPHYRDDIFEITGLWLCRSMRSKILGTKFWLKFYSEMIKMDKPHFIYAYSSAKPKLGEIYALSRPQRIFKGFTKMLPGMTEPDDEVIEVGSMNAIHMAWIMDVPAVMKKLFGARSAKKRKMYQ